ncbi:oligosaccharide flippase family protein [Oricola nitratireducens]|uniref:oligosaccharide flippase family protein n=1 Tax=Oricola nitratireducens TaxID=2775868 RepID=UPI001866F225|nr:oligosaccharide flippase family protein [Oricola nitratireducens]
MAIVKRALILSTGDRYLTIVFNFVTLAIVSRILTPAEIGVSVIGLSVIGIAMALREFASSSFVIQQHELDPEDIRAAFSVIQVLTLIIVLVLAVTASPLAKLFGQPGLTHYLRVMSVCLLLDTVSTFVIALLRREMAFGRVAVINTTLAVTASVTTVTLALHGFSYMSFAWGWLAASVVAGTLAIWFRPHLWMFKPSLKRAAAIIRFGGYNGVSVVLNLLTEHLPYALLGKVASPAAAAMYNRAFIIGQFPEKVFIGGAKPVVLPVFATESREGRSVKEAYLTTLEIVTALQWPALLVLAILAYPAVDIMLGSQWVDAVGPVRIFAVASVLSFNAVLDDPALMAVGAVRDLFIRALIVFPVTATVITVAALSGGLMATALSMIFLLPFRGVVSMLFSCRRLSIGREEIAAAMWRSGFVTIATIAGPLLYSATIEASFKLGIGEMIVATALAGIGWLCALWLTRHRIALELDNLLAHIGTMPIARHLPRRGPIGSLLLRRISVSRSGTR